MPLGEWFWGVVILNAVVFIVAIMAAAGLLARTRGEPTGRTSEWYRGAIELTQEVTQTTQEIRRPADPDRVARQLLPLSARIRRHVREAPESVDDRIYRELFELAIRCQQVALEHEPVGAGGPFLDDRLDSLAEEMRSVEARIPSA